MPMTSYQRTFRASSAVCFLICLTAVCGCGSGPTQDAARRDFPVPDAKPTTAVNARVADARRDLGRDEEQGGHTLKRHVGRSDEQLRERLEHEGNVSAASTWTDRASAETVVAEALTAEKGRIENWIRRGYPRPNLALRYDAGHMIGRSLRRGDSAPVGCTRAVIVLRADGPDSFYVLTTYPEARE
jgi:hypothetical protein